MENADINKTELEDFSAEYYEKLLLELEDTEETLIEQLEERMVALKTNISYLKKDVFNEREAWKTEVKEMVKLDKEFQKQKFKEYGENKLIPLEMLTTAILKSQIITQQEINKEFELETFKKKLLEAENMCSTEMLKIKQSLTNIKSLEAMANEWEWSLPVSTKLNIEQETPITEKSSSSTGSSVFCETSISNEKLVMDKISFESLNIKNPELLLQNNIEIKSLKILSTDSGNSSDIS